MKFPEFCPNHSLPSFSEALGVIGFITGGVVSRTKVKLLKLFEKYEK